jgi:hypothetical protein
MEFAESWIFSGGRSGFGTRLNSDGFLGLYQTIKLISGHLTHNSFEIEGSPVYGKRRMLGHQCAQLFIANPILDATQIH